MEKPFDPYFSYPPNIHDLDLATMVTMYRARGEPKKAPPGDYLACAITGRLIREGKWWFGLYYSQESWDGLLTQGSEGFPMTDTELAILGMTLASGDGELHREDVEKRCGVPPKLAYLIINDLKQFGFLVESRSGLLTVSDRGKRALRCPSRLVRRPMQIANRTRFSSPSSEPFSASRLQCGITTFQESIRIILFAI